jgi:hypothetical protein
MSNTNELEFVWPIRTEIKFVPTSGIDYTTNAKLNWNPLGSSECETCRRDWLPLIHINYTGGFLSLLTGSRLCASRRPVHRRLRDAYEFYCWINMPVGRQRSERSSYIHITGGVENAVLLHVDIFRNYFVKEHKYNSPSCTYSIPDTNFRWMEQDFMG